MNDKRLLLKGNATVAELISLASAEELNYLIGALFSVKENRDRGELDRKSLEATVLDRLKGKFEAVDSDAFFYESMEWLGVRCKGSLIDAGVQIVGRLVGEKALLDIYNSKICFSDFICNELFSDADLLDQLLGELSGKYQSFDIDCFYVSKAGVVIRPKMRIPAIDCVLGSKKEHSSFKNPDYLHLYVALLLSWIRLRILQQSYLKFRTAMDEAL